MELEALVVSAEAAAKGKIADALHGLVGIEKTTGEIMPDRAITKLDARVQIVAYLLACRAGVILGIRERSDANPDEISSSLSLDVRRTGEALSRLKRVCAVRTTRGYEIPLARVAAACEEISKGRKAQ